MAVIVEEDATAEQLLTCLAYFNEHAKRAPALIGKAGFPTRWDSAHADIDCLLDALMTKTKG